MRSRIAGRGRSGKHGTGLARFRIQAVRLVKTHGLRRTAMPLGLDYYILNKRAEETANQPQSSSPAFVELTSPVGVGKQGLFELDNGATARMRVQLLGYDAADVTALLRSFWSDE
jgi:hypothetical protein